MITKIAMETFSLHFWGWPRIILSYFPYIFRQ